MRTVASRTRRALLSDGRLTQPAVYRERQCSPKTTQPADGVSFTNVQPPLPRGPPLRGRGLLCSAAGGLRWPAFPQGEIALLGLLIHSHVLALHFAGSSQRSLTSPSTLPSPPGGDTDAAGAPAKTNALLELLPPSTVRLCTAPRPCGASRHPCLRRGFLPGQQVLHTSAQPVFMRTAASRTQFAPLGGGELTRPAFPRERTLSWGYSTRPLGFPNQRPPPFHAGRRFADVTCSSQRWGGLTRHQRPARRHPVIHAEYLGC